MTELTCYFCNSTSITKSNKRRSISYFQIRSYYLCSKCHGFSLYPKLKEFEIESLYSLNYIKDVNPGTDLDSTINVERFKDLIVTVTELNSQRNLIFLDYGCGADAEVITRTNKLGCKSYGVEVEKSAREQAHLESGCEIFSPEEIISSGLQFDLIFLGDVLEHLNSPHETLRDIYQLMRPNGVLVVQGPLEGAPTISNFLLSIKSVILRNSPTDFPPYHVSLATRRSIVEVLKNANLDVQMLRVTEPLWPASRFGSRQSLSSLSSAIFSFTKLLDILLNKVSKRKGTRFYLEAEKRS